MKKSLLLISLFLIITCFLGSCKGNNENNSNESYSQGLEFQLNEDGLSYSVIGYGTFDGENLVIPSQYNGKPVVAIEDYALWGNHIVKTVVIPDSVVKIGEFAFYSCSQLESISIGKSLSQIGDFGIYCNPYLKVTLDSNNKNFKLINGHLCSADGKELIYYSINRGDNTIVVPNGITKVNLDFLCLDARDASSFVFNEIDGSQYIGSEENPYLMLYRSDYANNTVNIHKDTRIIYQLNWPVDVGHVVIPDYIECICPSTYYATTFEVDDNNPYYKMVDGGLYTKDGKTLVRAFPTGSEFTIIDGVETISYYAFASYLAITHITIPDTVKRIEAYAFYSYSHDTKIINIPSSLEYIGLYAFMRCGADSIVIPASTKTIAPYAFSNARFKNVEILAPLERLSSCAFYESYGLESIILPNTLTHIESGAFMLCKSLKNVNIPNSVGYIGGSAFWGCESLENVVIPNSVVHIEFGAFMNCTSLESVVIPDSVVYLGDRAFENCSLKNVVIGNSITKINNAFVNNQLLESIVMGDSVEVIGIGAFAGCKLLKNITLGNSIKEIGYQAFYNCSSLESINLPSTVTFIDEEAFANCSSLKSIYIPKSVEKIGGFSFYGCNQITIYCEADSKPQGWENDWNYSNLPVVWGYKK